MTNQAGTVVPSIRKTLEGERGAGAVGPSRGGVFLGFGVVLALLGPLDEFGGDVAEFAVLAL